MIQRIVNKIVQCSLSSNVNDDINFVLVSCIIYLHVWIRNRLHFCSLHGQMSQVHAKYRPGSGTENEPQPVSPSLEEWLLAEKSCGLAPSYLKGSYSLAHSLKGRPGKQGYVPVDVCWGQRSLHTCKQNQHHSRSHLITGILPIDDLAYPSAFILNACLSNSVILICWKINSKVLA